MHGKRLLGKQTLAFMTADHTGNRPGRPPGLGFGLGFEVRTTTGEAALPGSVGEYGWAGNAGTLFWIDPKEQLIAIYMVQVSDPDRVALRNQFRTMVQSAHRSIEPMPGRPADDAKRHLLNAAARLAGLDAAPQDLVTLGQRAVVGHGEPEPQQQAAHGRRRGSSSNGVRP